MLAALAAVVLLTGCKPWGHSKRQSERSARNDAATAVLRQALVEIPGVVSSNLDYSDDFAGSGAAQASLIVSRADDLEQVADATVRQVWQSPLDPLKSIRVSVIVDGDRKTGLDRNLNIFDNEAELEARYGPRPVGRR